MKILYLCNGKNICGSPDGLCYKMCNHTSNRKFAMYPEEADEAVEAFMQLEYPKDQVKLFIQNGVNECKVVFMDGSAMIFENTDAPRPIEGFEVSSFFAHDLTQKLMIS